ncbi:unnamed protein product [Phaedon cochleariae]|uniref:Transcription termination factor 1 n=1 Tax=Phaedon cochleariae TaxID=80249 RepID=A0A9N9SEC4_PHACE|nr:unnamed protein product [Phaedon cochleariae]
MKKEIDVHPIPEENYSEFEDNIRKRKKKKSRQQNILSPENVESESGTTGHRDKKKKSKTITESTKDSTKKKKFKFISESVDMNVWGGDIKLQEHSDTALCDDESASSLQESEVIPSSLDSEIDHNTITVSKKKKKKQKSHEKDFLNVPQFRSMKKYVKQEFPIDWQAVAEYLDSENFNSSNGTAENTESDYHPDNQSLIMPTKNIDTILYGYEIPMDDEIGKITSDYTNSEKLKVKRKHRKKHKNKIDEIKTDPNEMVQMINYCDSQLDEEMVLKSEYQRMEPQSDSIPKKKSKKRETCNQGVIEDIPLIHSNPKLDQFLSSELLMGEAIPTTPRKQKREKLEEWDREYLSKSAISIPKAKRRRRLGDISVSGILRDYEQSIITSDVLTVQSLQTEPQEELSDGPQMENKSAIENPTPISQKYNRYYSIYKSDSDEPTSPKKCINGTSTNDYRTYSNEDTEVDVEENCRFPNQLANIENNTKTRKSTGGATDSDSDYSDELTRPVDGSMHSTRKTILDYFKSSKGAVSGSRNSISKRAQQIVEISSHKNDENTENVNKKSQTPPVSLQDNISEDHTRNIDNNNIKNEKTVMKIISQNSTKNGDFNNSKITKNNVEKNILNGNENSRDFDSELEISTPKEKVNSPRPIVQTNHTTGSQEKNYSEQDEPIVKTRSGRNFNNKSAVETTELEKEILKSLTIFLPFPIPPLHKTILYRKIPEDVQHLSIKSGAFSKDEDNVIMNNWKQFCDEHNLDVKPCAFFHVGRLKKIERIKFLQYISHGLDDRLPSRVFARFKKIYENMSIRRGRFSQKEDKEILRFMKEHGDSDYPFVNLAKILNRNNTAVLKRYETLTNTKNQSKLTWTADLSGKLIRRMMRIGKCERVEDLENLQLSTEQWNKLSRKMDMSVKKLRRGWKITVYPRLFSKASILEVKNKIFHLLKERKESDWRKVDWKEIAKHFVGFTPEKVYNLFRTLVNFHVPKNKQSDLGECLKVLNGFSIRQIKKFRRFVFKDGQLKYENEESEEDES